MPRLDLLIGVVSLILCCNATMTPDEVRSEETTTQLQVSATPEKEIRSVETTTKLQVSAMPEKEMECTKPQEIENGFLQGNWSEETFPHGHTVTYACRPGYTLSNRIRMICLGGKWVTLSNGHCKKKSCGHPGDIPFGTFKLRDEHEFVFGAVVEYSCDEGYQLISKYKTRVCSADGWTHRPPHCEARLCPPVNNDSVKIQTTVNDDEFSMGDVIKFKCINPKHLLKGPSMIYCTANGTWNMDPPTCKGSVSCTVQMNDMRRNNIQLKSYRKLHFEDNEDVQFECVSRYKISDPAKLLIRCNNGVLQYPTCSMAGILDQQHQSVNKNQLVNASCGRPPNIINGEIISPIRNSYHSGSSVKYQCPNLYKLQGSKMIRCQNGKWNPPPTCLEPCTTSEENMKRNHIAITWNPNKKLCMRNDQKKIFAKKCYVKHNDYIKFTCLPGYKTSQPKALISKCERGILPYPVCKAM